MSNSTKTIVTLMRANGKGIQGTIENAKHHAQEMLPFIRAMKPVVDSLGFKLWRQGHNVHEFVTHDGRRFTLRGIIRDEDAGKETPRYIGVRLSLRLSRSVEYRLYDIDSVEQVPTMLAMMTNLAKNQIGRDSALMQSECSS